MGYQSFNVWQYGNHDVHTFSFGAAGLDLKAGGQDSFAIMTWPVANLAIYCQFVIPTARVINQLFWSNAGTVNGNTDVAVWDEALTKLVSTGSTVNSGANNLQAVNVTDTTIGAGRYWLGISSDSSTHQYYGDTPFLACMDVHGLKQQTSAFTLPASPTFAAPASSVLPIFGFTHQSVA